MKNKYLLLLCGVLLVSSVQAHTAYKDTCYSLSFSFGYGYNETYRHFGDFTAEAFLPIQPTFEGEINLRAQTANIYDFGVHLRPKFLLPVGELYFDTQHYQDNLQQIQRFRLQH